MNPNRARVPAPASGHRQRSTSGCRIARACRLLQSEADAQLKWPYRGNTGEMMGTLILTAQPMGTPTSSAETRASLRSH